MSGGKTLGLISFQEYRLMLRREKRFVCPDVRRKNNWIDLISRIPPHVEEGKKICLP
jgi:hypothetical protein